MACIPYCQCICSLTLHKPSHVCSSCARSFPKTSLSHSPSCSIRPGNSSAPLFSGICFLERYVHHAMIKKPIDSIESVIADLKRGKMVVIVDDAARENEGDLIMAAEHITPDAVNFMSK